MFGLKCVFFLIVRLNDAQIVRCGPKDWLCVDGRNKEGPTSDVDIDNDKSTIPGPSPTPDDTNQNTTSPITPTPQENTTEIPSVTPSTNTSGIGPVEITSDGFPQPFPAQYQQIWK